MITKEKIIVSNEVSGDGENVRISYNTDSKNLEVRSGGLFLSTMIVDMVELNMVKNGIIAILKELENEL